MNIHACAAGRSTRRNGKKPLWVAALLAALLGVPLGTMAGRPLATEDAGVLDKGDCELQGYALRQNSEGVKSNGLHLDGSCGVGKLGGHATQLSAGYTRWRSEGETEGVPEFGAKTAIIGESDDSMSLALAYSFNLAKDEARRFKHDEGGVKAAISMPAGDFKLHGNLGVLRSFADKRYRASWAAAVERNELLGGLFDVAVETFGVSGHPAWVQAGTRWVLVKDKLHLDASFGRELSDSRERLVTVGFKVAW